MRTGDSRCDHPTATEGRRPPAAPTQRSPVTGWSITPRTGISRSSRAIRVPKVGRPVMNARVPSIGSRTQRSRASGLSSPNSSPIMPKPGKRAARTARNACSAVRSATVTRLRPSLRSAARASSPAARKNGRTAAPATSAADSAAAIQPSMAACSVFSIGVPGRGGWPQVLFGHSGHDADLRRERSLCPHREHAGHRCPSEGRRRACG